MPSVFVCVCVLADSMALDKAVAAEKTKVESVELVLPPHANHQVSVSLLKVILPSCWTKKNHIIGIFFIFIYIYICNYTTEPHIKILSPALVPSVFFFVIFIPPGEYIWRTDHGLDGKCSYNCCQVLSQTN